MDMLRYIFLTWCYCSCVDAAVTGDSFTVFPDHEFSLDSVAGAVTFSGSAGHCAYTCLSTPLCRAANYEENTGQCYIIVDACLELHERVNSSAIRRKGW